jgi:predicted nucleic acid-binding protein
VSTRVVCDASALTAVLIDAGPDGQWATAEFGGVDLAAPSLVEFETANILRRQQLGGLISPDQAAQAHADLLEMAIEHWPYELLATRAWQLRHNLSIYDASYVALAELLGTTLVTLDRRIGRAPGPQCPIVTP